MFAVLIAGVLNSLVLAGFILLTYFNGYDYFLNNVIRFTQNDVYTSIYFSIFITSIVTLVFSTRVSDLFFNLIMHNRNPIPREKERLESLLEEVHCAAIKKFGLKRRKVSLKIKDDKAYNLSAVGLGTVSVNRRMYEDWDDHTIKAIMGHELSHIYNRDSINLGIIYILISISSVAIMICSTVMIFCVALARGFSRGITIFFLPFILGFLCCVGLIFFILVTVFFCFNVFLRFYYRQNEYRADKFASELGYTRELINFFDQIKDSDYELKGIKKLLFSTHPKIILRIGRLEKVLLKKATA